MISNNFDIYIELIDKIFEKEIIPQIVGDISQQDIKIAYITGGQPGSGKSSLAREILRKNSNLVFINGDDLRVYHPNYYKYLLENDKEAADLTQKVCNYWIENLINYCIDKKLNFIVEGTMRRAETPINTAKILKDNNYNVDFVIISVPKELSLFTIKNRYEEAKNLGLPMRYTKEESHNEAFENIEYSIEKIADSKLGNKILIYRRLYDSLEKEEFENNDKNKLLRYFREGRERKVFEDEKEIKNIFNLKIKNL